MGEGRLADPAQSEAREGDSHLGRGDRVVQLLDRGAHRDRAELTLVHQLLDARPAHGDERELGGHEVGVRTYQHQQPGDADQVGEQMIHGSARPRADGYSTSRRPSSARANVTMSEYSRSDPIGTPRAIRVTRTPSGRSSLVR